MKSISIDDMHALANQKGGKCLSNFYISAKTKLKWKCKEGHIWEAEPNNIKQGKWCPFCAGKYQTIEDMRNIAKYRGGLCLSSVYHSAKTKLEWKCKEGHIWEAVPSNIKQGYWCPFCGKKRAAKKRIGSIEELKEIAKNRGGVYISEEYVLNHSKAKWRCKIGHIWQATPANVKRGTWCPLCARKKVRHA